MENPKVVSNLKKKRKEILECIGIHDPIQIQILCISFVLEN